MKYVRRKARVKGRMTATQKETYEAAVLRAYKASGGEFTYTETTSSGRGRRLSGVDTEVVATLSYGSSDDAEAAAKGTQKAQVDKELADQVATTGLEEVVEVVTTETVEVVDEPDTQATQKDDEKGNGDDTTSTSSSSDDKPERKPRRTDCTKLPQKQHLTKAVCESASARTALKTCAQAAGGAAKLTELAKACATKRGLKTKMMKYVRCKARVKGRMTATQKETYEAAV